MLDARLLLLLLFILVITILAVLPPARSFISDRYGRLRGRLTRRPARTGVTVISASGDEFDLPSSFGRDRTDWGSRVQAMVRSRRLLAALGIILIGLLALPRLPRMLLGQQTDQFVVLIAPFRDQDGTVGQTGRSVAGQLVDVLPERSGGRVVARGVAEPPADESAAQALLERENADALIWGTVTDGGLLDEPSLLPLLAYRPTGAFAPAGWDGYTGRFAIAPSYDLATTWINGQAVLPRLLGAMADYGAGQVDSAFSTLGELLDNYPELASALPYEVRGNILWANGEYEQAAGEYRRGLALETDRLAAQGQRTPLDPRAVLANNLGAILQDAGGPDARATLDQSVDLLDGRDLGALRYNLGISALRAGEAAAAVSSLEQAQRLLPASTPLLLTLSEAYRMNGQFDQSQEALNAALQHVRADATATIPDQRDLTSSRLRRHTSAACAAAALAAPPGQGAAALGVAGERAAA